MKKILLLTLVIIVALSYSYSQNPVPNASSQNWTSGEPDSWSTFNNIGVTVTQSSDAHTGSSCARGDVEKFFGTNVGPFLISILNDTGNGFPVSQNYTTLEFWYKMNSDSGDQLDVVVAMYDDAGNVIGVNGQFFNTQLTYTHAAMPIFYSTGTAATCYITMAIVNAATDTVHLASFMEIDDVSLTNNPTGIAQNNLSSIQSFSVFPNPAKDGAMLRYSIVNPSLLEISVYDMTGKKVFASSHPTVPGRHEERLDVSNLNAGVYICTLKTGNDVWKQLLSVIR